MIKDLKIFFASPLFSFGEKSIYLLLNLVIYFGVMHFLFNIVLTPTDFFLAYSIGIGLGAILNGRGGVIFSGLLSSFSLIILYFSGLQLTFLNFSFSFLMLLSISSIWYVFVHFFDKVQIQKQRLILNQTGLEDTITALGQETLARTNDLNVVATFSGRLSAILDLDQLLSELVNQVKEQFHYYHAHIYLLDENGKNLVVAEGTGKAGAEMKANQHGIPLQKTTSLVARSARNNEIVRIDNVRLAKEWLPNPLLPETHSEMAVPITLAGEVVGVLDVQQDKVAGLDTSDANILQFLANQVAVAIRNARLFAQVETALVEANALQARYLEQTWNRQRLTDQNAMYHYQAAHTLPLNQAIISLAQAQSLQLTSPALEQLPDTTDQTILAPILIRGKAIGTIQIHSPQTDRVQIEADLDFLADVLNEFAQIAENLRLFDETRERADRDRFITQVSDRMRRATDLEHLLKITVSELTESLETDHTFIQLSTIDLPNN